MRALALALACGLSAWASDFQKMNDPEPLPAPLATKLRTLSVDRLQQELAFLTHPAQEGRGLGSHGLEGALSHVEAALKHAGVPPLGKTYRQTVPLRELRPGASALSLRLDRHTFRFRSGQNAILPPLLPGALRGEVVYLGFALQEPALGRDDFQGRNLRGKVVVFRAGLPEGAPWTRADLVEKYASSRPADRYDHRLALLEKAGARAAIALEPDLTERLAAGQEPLRPAFLAAPEAPASTEPPLARLPLSAALLKALETSPEATASFAFQGAVKDLRSSNVLGWIEGADPRLRREAIVIGAHVDHLGILDGRLHPGADDNASGVSALLELARAFARGPRPKRSVVLAFWTGEEEGKFGSGHYTRHPRWPLKATNAYINLDMIGHPWTRAEIKALLLESQEPGAETYLEDLDPARFTEPGLPPNQPALAAALRQAAAGTGMGIHLDWTDGKHGGSDYKDFARLDVPFIRFFGSYFPDYHQPGDTLASLDPAQVHRMARLALATAWLLADR